MEIGSEQLAHWYLRLNGFLTIPDFIVHPDYGSNQRTDVDIYGVRFPHRVENFAQPMRDDVYFDQNNKIVLALVEVKRSVCDLNRSWRNPNTLLSMISAVGILPEVESRCAAENLSTRGHFEDERFSVTMMCIGETANSDIEAKYPKVPQVIWDDVKRFIYTRFSTYRTQKRSHQTWPEEGKRLWEVFSTSRTVNEFLDTIKIQ